MGPSGRPVGPGPRRYAGACRLRLAPALEELGRALEGMGGRSLHASGRPYRIAPPSAPGHLGTR